MGGRPFNEDAVLLRPELALYLLADGAGGRGSGNVAAVLATTTIARFFEDNAEQLGRAPEHDSLGLPIAARMLSASLHAANAAILRAVRSNRAQQGMASTIIAVLFMPDHGVVHIAHVGNSRCLRYRHGLLDQLTQDHSLANDILEMRPTLGDLRASLVPGGAVTRALGALPTVRVTVQSHQLVAGDRYLLCSDGLADALFMDQLAQIVGLEASCEERVQRLIEAAIDAGTSDNVSAVLIDGSELRAPPRARRDGQTLVSARDRLAAAGAKRDSMAEIVVMPATPESDPGTMVVPPEAATQEMVDAVNELMAPSSGEIDERSGDTWAYGFVEPDEKPRE